MFDIYEAVRVRLGLTNINTTKALIYAHGYKANNEFLAEIAINDSGSYQYYSGNMDAFGEILRVKLNRLHKEITYG